MPRPFDSSSRYLPPTPADEAAELARKEGNDISAMEPLTSAPTFESIIWLASKLQIYGEKHPSSTALKSVAFLGQGATFSVYRSRPYRGRVYAIKQPRLVFEHAQDEAKTMRQLYSLHLELRVLTDQRICSHRHIAKLVSIVWEEHADHLGQLWPSLVMEHADLGTLSACFDQRDLELNTQGQRVFCFQIGSALHFLHQNRVIHGDIKPDNVLVFRSKDPNILIPKLSDFGYCVLDGEDGPGFPQGTPGWEAPEVIEGKQKKEFLPLSDAYSFGLLTWYVANNGKNPFQSLAQIPDPIDGDEARDAIQTLKLTPGLPEIASATLPEDRNFYSTVFTLTLMKDPLRRDLPGVLSFLDQDSPSDVPHQQEPPVHNHELERVSASSFSLRELRHVGLGIQIQILDSLESRARSTTYTSFYNDVQRAEASFAVARCCLESMGRRRPVDAIDWLIRAANFGHPAAGILIYRVSASLGQFQGRYDEILAFLKASAESGVIVAIDDLLAYDKTSGEEILASVRTRRREQYPDGNTMIKHDNGSPLHHAACCGDLPLLERLLHDRGGELNNLNAQDDNGRTPLLQACMARNSSAVVFLLDRGADASIPDSQGDTPLHWLFFFDDDPSIDYIAKRLMDCGADIHAQTSKEGWDSSSFKELSAGTPLHRAATWNSGNAVSALLHYNANPLQPSRRHELTTPLWLACTFHSWKALQMMLNHLRCKDINMNQILNGKWPLLMPVLDQGYYYRTGGTLGRIARHGSSFKQATTETIRALKSHGASMVLPSGTPIISSAILLRCFDVVDGVLKLAPEMIEHVDSTRKQPPLHFAVQQDRADLVELLISHGADVDSRNHTGISALANYANYHAGIDIPRILLQKGLRFEVPQNHYQTPFFGAISRAAFDLAAFILRNTASGERNVMINTPATSGPTFAGLSPPGLTILGYLLGDLHRNTPRLVDRLFGVVHSFHERLDFVVQPGNGETAMHMLAEYGRHQRIDSVIAAVGRRVVDSCRGVEVDRTRVSDRRTALHLAVVSSNYDLASILLESGADPNVLDEMGKSPLSLLRDMATFVSPIQNSLETQEVIQQMESDIYAADGR